MAVSDIKNSAFIHVVHADNIAKSMTTAADFLTQNPTHAVAMMIDPDLIDKIHKAKQNLDEIINDPNSNIRTPQPLYTFSRKKKVNTCVLYKSIFFDGANPDAPTKTFDIFANEELKLANIFAQIAQPFFKDQNITLINHHGSPPEHNHIDGHQTLVMPTQVGGAHTLHTVANEVFSFPTGSIACLGSHFEHEAPQQERHIIRAFAHLT